MNLIPTQNPKSRCEPNNPNENKGIQKSQQSRQREEVPQILEPPPQAVEILGNKTLRIKTWKFLSAMKKDTFFITSTIPTHE